MNKFRWTLLKSTALATITSSFYLPASFAQDVPRLAEVVVTPVPQLATSTSPGLSQSPGAVGAPLVVNMERDARTKTGVDEALTDLGFAAYDAANSLGLATGLSLRGFAVSNQGSSQLQASRAFLNGHSDIAWRFARDPVTVSRVEILQGQDSTLLGAGSPAGALHYVSKQPLGEAFTQMQTALGSRGNKRLTLDAERHLGPLQNRVAVAVQRGDTTAEGVEDNRDVLLLSSKLPLGQAALRLELEYHGLHLPFPFGTAYVGNRFIYDTPLVDPRSSASRHYRRQALYADTPLTDDLALQAYWQQASSTRQETLLGFFDVRNATQLRGYYRLLHEDNSQRDIGLRLNGKLRTGSVAHDWTLAWQELNLSRDFQGPQNIGGFTLNAAQPVFPQNLSTLALAPRFAFERYHERGLALADTLRVGAFEVRAGLRRSHFELDASTSATTTPARVAQAAHTSHSLGLGYPIGATQRTWLSRTEGFLPNRGRLSGGDFLLPSQSSQWELGWQYQSADKQTHLTLSAFDLRQTNLPARHPTDPDAFVLIGASRSQGLELRTGVKAWTWDWQAQLTQLRARIRTPTSTTQGSYLVGIPAAYGALSTSGPIFANEPTFAGLRGRISLPFAGERPGDDKASFAAPGYGIVNVGLEGRINPQWRWGTDIQNLADRRYIRALTGADNAWQGKRRELKLWASWGQ